MAAIAEEAILGYLYDHDEISDSSEFAAEHGLDHTVVVNVLKSLFGFEFVKIQEIKRYLWDLTAEAETYIVTGTPEVQLFLAVPADGSIPIKELQKELDPKVFKIGSAQRITKDWVQLGAQVSRKVQDVEDKVKDLLIRIQDGQAVDMVDIKDLKGRKLIELMRTWTCYSVRKGPLYAPK